MKKFNGKSVEEISVISSKITDLSSFNPKNNTKK